MTKDHKEKKPNQEEVIIGEIKAFPLPVSLLASHLKSYGIFKNKLWKNTGVCGVSISLLPSIYWKLSIVCPLF